MNGDVCHDGLGVNAGDVGDPGVNAGDVGDPGSRAAASNCVAGVSVPAAPSVEAVAAAGVAPVATTESLGGPRLLQPSLRCVPRWLAETTGLWVPAVIHGTALLPDDDGGRLLWILASGLPREASGLPRGAGF